MQLKGDVGAPFQVVSISDALSKGVSHTLDLRIHADPYCESDKVSHFMCALVPPFSHA
jgi:hypothetical protein